MDGNGYLQPQKPLGFVARNTVMHRTFDFWSERVEQARTAVANGRGKGLSYSSIHTDGWQSLPTGPLCNMSWTLHRYQNVNGFSFLRYVTTPLYYLDLKQPGFRSMTGPLRHSRAKMLRFPSLPGDVNIESRN